MNKIELREQKLVHQGRFLNYMTQSYLSTKGKVAEYEMVVRNKVNNVIAVLPVTKDDKVILIKQFRIPMGREIIEIPAGIGDKLNEEPLDILRRELKEEVGYQSANIDFCFESPTSQGMTNETCRYYIATDCTKADCELEHEGAEQIEVLEFKMKTIKKDLENLVKDGYMVDSKIYALLHWYEDMKKQKGFLRRNLRKFNEIFKKIFNF